MKRPNLLSIKSQLIILVLVTICPIVILFLHSAHKQQEIATDQIKGHLLNLVHFLEKEQTQMVNETQLLLQFISGTEELETADSAQCAKLFNHLLSQYPSYTDIVALYPDGRVFCSGNSNGDQSRANPLHSWFRQTLKSKNFVISNNIGNNTNRESILICSYPVLTDRKRVQFILTIGLNLNWLIEQLDESELPENSTLTLVDQRGLILARYPDATVHQERLMQHFDFSNILSKDGAGSIISPDVHGIRRLFAVHKFEWDTVRGYILLGIPEKAVIAQIDTLLVNNLVWLGIVTILAVGLGWVSGHFFFIKKTDKILDVAEKLSHGDLQARTGITSGSDELRQVGQALDSLGVSLEKWQNEMNQARQDLYVSRERVRQLARHLQNLQEQERARIAREIHDELAQVLTILKIELTRFGDNTEPIEQQPERIQSMLELLDQANRAIRDLISQLRPEILDILGLEAALEWLVNKYRQQTEIRITLNIVPDNYSIPEDLSTGIFRIVQEALTNIERHSEATQATIQLAKTTDNLQLVISDNGRGLQEGNLRKPASFGLLGIRERVEYWDGTCSIKNDKSGGVEIRVSIPFPLNRETA